MAENKRIRVSADTSPLQGLRHEVESMWNDFNQMEGRFKDISEQALSVIQRQIDLLKERNTLFALPTSQPRGNVLAEQRGSLIDPNTGRPFATTTDTRNGLVGLRGNDGFVFNKMLAELSRIAEILEKGERDRKNDSDEAPTAPDADGTPVSAPVAGGTGIRGRGRGFTFPTSLSGLLRGLPLGIGAAIMALGGALGKETQFRTQMYGAENAFERENLRGQHWLLNAVTFGISGQMAQRREIDRRAFQNFEDSIQEMAARSGMGMLGTTVALLGGNLKDVDANAGLGVGLANGRRGYLPTYNLSDRPDNTNVAPAPNVLEDGGMVYISPDADKAFRERGLTPNAEREVYVEPTRPQVTTADNLRMSNNGFVLRGSYLKSDGIAKELHNWRTDLLGMESGEYASRMNNLLAAGMDSRATGFRNGGSTMDNINFFNDYTRIANQVMLWGKARGLTDEQQAAVMRAARFDNSGLAANDVISSFDVNLGRMGYRGYARSGRLSENLDTYNRIAQQVLSVAGGVNTEEIVRTMTGVQQMTGMQGPQLARVQEFMTGANVSQDEVSKAFMMREARKMAPNATFSELMAMIENPTESGLMQNVVKSLYEDTGGGEQFRATLKSFAPGLHWEDINKLDKSLKESGGDYKAAIDEVFGGTISERTISEEAAANVSNMQRSTAATEEYHATQGADRYTSGDGEEGDLAGALAKALASETLRIIDTTPDRLTTESLKKSIQEGISEGLNDVHITMD